MTKHALGSDFRNRIRGWANRSIRKWMLGLMIATGLCAGPPAWAETVFSNYDGFFCSCGFVMESYAAEFTPASTFDFTGAAAFLDNNSAADATTSLALYSESGGLPATMLWGSGSLNVAAGSALVSASYAGTPVQLESGTDYFLVVDVSSSALAWLGAGTTAVPFDAFYHSVWQSDGSTVAQFEVFGDPLASAVPEPSSMALLGAGLAGFAATQRRVFISRRQAMRLSSAADWPPWGTPSATMPMSAPNRVAM